MPSFLGSLINDHCSSFTKSMKLTQKEGHYICQAYDHFHIQTANLLNDY